ncbi:MAG: hypothetical protein ABIK37_00170 [candidate division WOR-3 bacterium]
MTIRSLALSVCAVAAMLLPTASAVAVPDVGCVEILSPPDTVRGGHPVVPRAVVINLGAEPATFPTAMEIYGAYSDTFQVEDLQPAAVETVAFAPWIPDTLGELLVECRTLMENDPNPWNDAQAKVCFVSLRDIAVQAIIVPSDTVDSGALVTPAVRFVNRGMESAAFRAFFHIGEFYHDSVLIEDLPPGETLQAGFTAWQVEGLGPTVARCSVACEIDDVPANDTLSRRFFIRGESFRDAEASAILVPAGIVLEGLTVVPRAVIRNNCSFSAEIRVALSLLDSTSVVYLDTIRRQVAPRSAETVEFAPWTASPAGEYSAGLKVDLVDDMYPDNDSFGQSFGVAATFHDVAATAIVAPAGRSSAGIIVPSAKVRNFGTYPETFTVMFSIWRGQNRTYSESTVVSLPQDDSLQVSFPAWNALAGTYTAVCSTALIGDTVPENDRITATCVVETIPASPGWHEVASIPLTPSNKPVKDGGAMTFVPGTGRIYALKGNKTGDFYQYGVTSDSWRTLAAFPEGTEEKTAGKGAALTSDGQRFIYATKGNNSFGFYSYDCQTNSWSQLPDVPLGGGKKVKGGTSLAYVIRRDTAWVYLLKGYKNELHRYSIAGQSWQTLPSAPVSAKGRDAYKDGSFMVYDQEHTLYIVRAKTNEVYAFDVSGDTWLQWSSLLPMVGSSGRSKKVKGGGSGTWYSDAMYCLKGGNTQELWAYFPAGDTWHEFDTIPALGSTAKKKKVKGGASLVSVGSTVFFAMKGNKTREFWRYRIPGVIGVAEQPAMPGPTLTRLPTIVRSVLYLPGASVAARGALLIDASGRRVMTLTTGMNDVRHLAPGVYYILPVSTQARSSAGPVHKVVIE